MATIKLILRENRVNKAGEAPLYIRVTKDRKPKYISLNFRLPPKSWNHGEQKIKGSYPNSTRLNAWLKTQVSETLNTIIDLQGKDKNVRTKDIKETILGCASPNFLEYARKYIKRAYLDKGKDPTYERYNSTLNKFEEYLDGRAFTFDDMTVSFLKDYESYLIKKYDNKTNTIGKDLKSFRRIINEAINDQVFPFEKNPFHRFKIKWENTEKNFLTENELAAFESYSVKEGTVRAVHKDVFVFACYAGGLRVSDIFRLKWLYFNGTHIIITTKKTGRQVSIKLPKKALAIIEKYRTENQSPSDFIFPILNPDDDVVNDKRLFKKINSKNSLANKNLKIIAQKVGIEKHISFHTSRHTWATRALSKGMKIHHVSKLLGHSSVKTTEVYAKIVNKDLDDAMDVFNS